MHFLLTVKVSLKSTVQKLLAAKCLPELAPQRSQPLFRHQLRGQWFPQQTVWLEQRPVAPVQSLMPDVLL